MCVLIASTCICVQYNPFIVDTHDRSPGSLLRIATIGTQDNFFILGVFAVRGYGQILWPMLLNVHVHVYTIVIIHTIHVLIILLLLIDIRLEILH